MSAAPSPEEARPSKEALAEAYRVIDAEREAQRNEKKAAAQKCVGKFYKYLNSFSSSETWWLYATVTGVRETGWPRGWSFQCDVNEQIEIAMAWDGITLDGGSWIEISAEEFSLAAHKLATQLAEHFAKATNA